MSLEFLQSHFFPNQDSTTASPLFEITMDNCLALPDSDASSDRAFNVVYEGGVLKCVADSAENMASTKDVDVYDQVNVTVSCYR